MSNDAARKSEDACRDVEKTCNKPEPGKTKVYPLVTNTSLDEDHLSRVEECGSTTLLRFNSSTQGTSSTVDLNGKQGTEEQTLKIAML